MAFCFLSATKKSNIHKWIYPPGQARNTFKSEKLFTSSLVILFSDIIMLPKYKLSLCGDWRPCSAGSWLLQDSVNSLGREINKYWNEEHLVLPLPGRAGGKRLITGQHFNVEHQCLSAFVPSFCRPVSSHHLPSGRSPATQKGKSSH